MPYSSAGHVRACRGCLDFRGCPDFPGCLHVGFVQCSAVPAIRVFSLARLCLLSHIPIERPLSSIQSWLGLHAPLVLAPVTDTLQEWSSVGLYGCVLSVLCTLQCGGLLSCSFRAVLPCLIRTIGVHRLRFCVSDIDQRAEPLIWGFSIAHLRKHDSVSSYRLLLRRHNFGRGSAHATMTRYSPIYLDLGEGVNTIYLDFKKNFNTKVREERERDRSLRPNPGAATCDEG